MTSFANTPKSVFCFLVQIRAFVSMTKFKYERKHEIDPGGKSTSYCSKMTPSLACVAGGILVPGKLFWRRSHVK